MPEFVCRYGTEGGDIREQLFHSATEGALRSEMEGKGYFVFDVRRKGFHLGAGKLLKGKGSGVKLHQFHIFNQELVALIRAGLPLLQCLGIILEKMPESDFRNALEDIRGRLRSGEGVSESFAAHPNMFPPVYCSTLLAGEKSGDLIGVLKRYIEYSKKISAVRKKVVNALVYPTILVAISVGVIGILVGVVIPKFSDFYADFNADLPLATQIVVDVSNIMKNHMLLILLSLAGSIVAIRFWGTTTAGRHALDRIKLKIPLVGGVFSKFAISQFSRTLATLLKGGIPLVNSVEVAAGALGNTVYSESMGEIATHVREGETLNETLEKTNLASSLMVQMVKVGEQTGALEDMLVGVSDFYDEELDNHISRMMALLEPIILVIMGCFVAGILLSMYLPIFQLSTL